MSQLTFLQPEVPAPYSVSALTRHIRELIEGDPALADIWVVGEVSNVSTPRSGHMYFTLKDAGATLRCVMWKPQVQRLRFPPRLGDAVEAHGRIGVFESGGQYQLYADNLRPAGQGALYQEFLRLKAKLESEGLFDPGRKRPLPAWPSTIGIATSPTGAALQDVLNTLRRRYPLVDVVLAPTPVQGLDAPPAITTALQSLEELKPDLILLVRGGGSLEDLWAFNDEGVVRAVAACSVPVITGVGHETDFTLADFASDLRAPTPTAAAEMATPDRNELRQTLDERGQALERAVGNRLQTRQWALRELQSGLLRQSPRERLRRERQRTAEQSRRLNTSIQHRIRLQREQTGAFRARLGALNPLAILQRGYAVVSDRQGRIIRSVAGVQKDDPIQARLHEGTLEAIVRSKKDT